MNEGKGKIINPKRLTVAITQYFNLEELKSLCFALAYDFEELGEGGKTAKVIRLVQVFERQNRLPQLAESVIVGRPKQVDWEWLKREDITDTLQQPGLSPYKGLDYFREDDAALFYGRDNLIAELIVRLHSQQFLAIVGASGIGKSSIVHAGIIPVLKKDKILETPVKLPGGCHEWPVYYMTPTATPLATLSQTLNHAVEEVNISYGDDSLALANHVQSLLENAGADRLLLVVDQFEEIFTQCKSKQEQTIFINQLINAANHFAIIIIALRADFYVHGTKHEELRSILENQQAIITPMNSAELVQVIKAPAENYKWKFEEGLVELLLEDMGEEPGALPLLSQALLKTWEEREGATMTLAGYVGSGGIHGAIAETADTVYRQLSRTEQEMARHIFLELTELGEGTEDTRRRMRKTDLMNELGNPHLAETVLDNLTKDRLVTMDRESNDEKETIRVTVTHEAIIREWPRLQQWLEDNREDLHIQRELIRAAQEWKQLNQDNNVLLRGAKLTQAREWSNDHQMQPLVQDFLLASHRSQRIRQVGFALAIIVTIIGLFAATIIFQGQAEENANIAATAVVAQNNFEQEALARATKEMEAIKNANTAATQEARANENANTAATREVEAVESANFAATEEARAILSENEAQQERRRSQAGELAGFSEDVREQDLFLSLLLAREAVNVTYNEDGYYTEKAQQVLYDALALPLPRTIHILGEKFDPSTKVQQLIDEALAGREPDLDDISDGASGIFSIAYSPDGSQIVTGECAALLDGLCAAGLARLWNSDGTLAAEMAGQSIVAEVLFSPDGSRIITRDIFVSGNWLWDTNGNLLAELGKDINTFTGWIDFNSDNNRILTANDDGLVRLWAWEGLLLAELDAHPAGVSSATFSPDGQLILTSGCNEKDVNDICINGIVRLWDANGNLLISFSDETGAITSAQFNPDGETIITTSCTERDQANGCSLSQARLWDREGNLLSDFASHDGGFKLVSFSPDGSRIFTNGSDGDLRLWDSQGELVAELEGMEGAFKSAWNNSGNRLAIVGSSLAETIFLLNNNGELVAELEIPRAFVNHVRFNPTGAHLIAVGAIIETTGASRFNGSLARIWDTNGDFVVDLIGHDGNVSDVRFSPEGTYLATSSTDGSARIWDIRNANYRNFVASWTGHTEEIFSAFLSKDGTLLLTNSWDGTARLWNANGKSLAVMNQFQGTPIFGLINENNSRMAIFDCNQTCNLSLWDTLGNQIASLDGYQSGINFHPDDDRIVIGAGEVGMVRVFDGNGTVVTEFMAHEQPLSTVFFTFDGEQILTASEDGTARLWTDEGEFVLELTGHTGPVNGARPHKAGTHFITFSEDNTVRLWTSAGELEKTITIEDGSVAYAAFDLTGSYMNIENEDGTVSLWTINGDLLVTWAGHTEAVEQISMNRAATRVITEDCDELDEEGDCQLYTIRLWDIEGNLITELHSSHLQLEAMFTPDGNHIIVTGCALPDSLSRVSCHEGAIWFWRTYPDIDSMLDEALIRAERTLTPAECQRYLRTETCP
ncbi:MAG: hypothetical protein DWQ04_23760 [Chloroflexi bacterium]|nr:MAG: hypothetical protein DWQ04_23760 [Chloroflexota bacterium]